ncbi:MAG: LemA family protein [Acidimicrobiia bacterium]
MSPAPFLLVLLLLVVAIWWIAIYNRLVKLRQLVVNSWSNVETELNRRYDLIPNLVDTVKGYAAHERALFEEVAAARSAAVATNGEDPARQEQPERDLIGRLRGLLAVAEDYPELKASEHFLELQKELAMTEDRIQLARRIYNANVRDNNILMQSIPSRWVAAGGDFAMADFFEIDPVEAETPTVELD